MRKIQIEAALNGPYDQLIEATVSRGGHVRVGLEDAPWQAPMTNAQWVKQAAEGIRKAGGEPASAKEVRAALAAISSIRE